MTTRYKVLLAALVLLSPVSTTMYVRLMAQVVTPRPSELRYKLLLNQPLANATVTGTIAGMTAMVVQDRRTSRCFLVVGLGDSIGLTQTECAE